jgi:hypothetical protein
MIRFARLGNLLARRIVNLLPVKTAKALQIWRIKARLRAETIANRVPHGLPGQLIVSLTSYPARFATLSLTLSCLRNQTVVPDRIMLWIARGDLIQFRKRFGSEIRGVSVAECDDVRSFTKLVPCLEQFPEAFIVTADDDMYYEPEWLETLVRAFDPLAPTIVCRRAHRIRVDDVTGAPLPQRLWEWDVQDEASRQPSSDLEPTGVAGILYPPGCLHRDATRRDLFLKLCPTSDDMWFYFMARRRGTLCKKTGGIFEQKFWPGSQDQSLWSVNKTVNDGQIKALVAEFGFPITSG